MGLKDALDKASAEHHGRGKRCRICHLLDTLPAEESEALAEFFNPVRNFGPKPIAQALADEGYGDLYYPIKNHFYICLARS